MAPKHLGRVPRMVGEGLCVIGLVQFVVAAFTANDWWHVGAAATTIGVGIIACAVARIERMIFGLAQSLDLMRKDAQTDREQDAAVWRERYGAWFAREDREP